MLILKSPTSVDVRCEHCKALMGHIYPGSNTPHKLYYNSNGQSLWEVPHPRFNGEKLHFCCTDCKDSYEEDPTTKNQSYDEYLAKAIVQILTCEGK